MSPEEKKLLERSLKLSEENNKILHKMQRVARWAFIWGLIKLVIIVVPLVVGFFLLQPYFEPLKENFKTLQFLLPR